MKSNMKVEFPCGYKFKCGMKVGFFDFGTIEMEEMSNKCPLHGKKCK